MDSDRGMCGTVTSDGGYAFGGVSYSFSGLLSEFWLVRTDQNGDTLWTENYGTNVLRTIFSPITWGEKGLPWASPGGHYGRPEGVQPQPRTGGPPR